MKTIKGSHVVVFGSGPSVKKYKNEIDNFISNNEVVIFGCNNINHIITPDYHFWGSAKRWREFGHLINKKSTLVFSKHFWKSTIREKWKGKYKTFNNVERMWKEGSDIPGSKNWERCQVKYQNGKMFGCVRDIATWAIFYAYINGAKKISVVGNDGYTLYSKKTLMDDQQSQHCYGKGMTDGFSYEYCRKKDWDKYKTLRLLSKYGRKKYGFSFEIITPTLYSDFFNPNILNVEIDESMQEWEDPDEKEYKELYNVKKEK